MLRHEQQTVRMALAAALHHSAGLKEKVEMQQNGASTGTEDRRQGRVGGGARDALRPTGTGDSTSGGAAGQSRLARAAEERPQPAALLRANSSPGCAIVGGRSG